MIEMQRDRESVFFFSLFEYFQCQGAGEAMNKIGTVPTFIELSGSWMRHSLNT